MDSCQICFESPTAAAAAPTNVDTDTATDTTTTRPLVRNLCSTSCPAVVCTTCLASHVRASLDACYAGILPRVRCPICLTRLNKAQWMTHVPPKLGDDDDTTLCVTQLDKRYSDFCFRACSLQAPCCHKVDYSHLPIVDGNAVPIDDVHEWLNGNGNDIATDTSAPKSEEVTIASIATATASTSDDGDNSVTTNDAIAEPQPAPEPAVTEFLARCKAFCYHRGDDGRALVQFALQQFASGDTNTTKKTSSDDKEPIETAEAVIHAALKRIVDDERRATLLLSFLYAQPATFTTCCSRAFCFNCKRNGHHAVCERERDVIDAAKCIARCRSCRITIVKVEGCDAVTCVCGHAMGWQSELAIQLLDRRGLLPVDMFDLQIYTQWTHWRAKTRNLNVMLQQQLHERDRRRWIATYAPLMRRVFGGFLWRLRAESRHSAFQRELFWRVYDQTHPENEADADAFAAALCAITV